MHPRYSAQEPSVQQAGCVDTRAYVYAGLFVIWWPGLYVMYTYMMKQRRKVIGNGFGATKLKQSIIDKKSQ